jgi:hypothetical protein
MPFLGLATSFWAEFLVARRRIGGSDGKPRRRREAEAYRSQVPPLSVPLRLRGDLLLLHRRQLKQEGRGWILREKAEIKLHGTKSEELLERKNGVVNCVQAQFHRSLSAESAAPVRFTQVRPGLHPDRDPDRPKPITESSRGERWRAAALQDAPRSLSASGQNQPL